MRDIFILVRENNTMQHKECVYFCNDFEKGCVKLSVLCRNKVVEFFVVVETRFTRFFCYFSVFGLLSRKFLDFFLLLKSKDFTHSAKNCEFGESACMSAIYKNCFVLSCTHKMRRFYRFKKRGVDSAVEDI